MTLKQQLFEENVSLVFIETGTNKGEGVALALRSGYARIVSIEENKCVFQIPAQKFGNDNRVILFNSSSKEVLYEIVREQKCACTFWIDAHDAERGTCAALDELGEIAAAPYFPHTIMIDDWEDFDTPKHGNISKASVIEALRRINPDYKIACYYAELGAPNILVAKV